MGLYRYDQMVGCLPDGSMHGYGSSLGQSRYSSGAEPVAKDTDTQPSPNNVQQYDACMKHGNMSVLG